jgi:type II secretory pathway predicted ATPase ExeA
MYEQVFNLTSRPFTSMHYVKHYFPAKDIDETLKMCQMIIDRGTGPVVVVGDHGTGKTLLLAMLEGAFKGKYLLVNLSAAAIRNREDLLQNILYQLQIYSRGMSENDMRMELTENLRNDRSNGIVLLVDDAQKLSTESIEELQLYLDFIREGQPHVRLVLAGSRGLEDRLADSRLIAFNQRVAGRGFLGCLSRDESEAYVRAHLERAGGDPDQLFHPEAYRAIQEVTDGRPRFINQVCDHAMIFSATRGVVPVTDSLIREAWFDIQRLPGAVAPAGSGAAADETSVSEQIIETGEADGWTVLEFGQLGDAAASTPESAAIQTPGSQAGSTEPSRESAPLAATEVSETPVPAKEAQVQQEEVASGIPDMAIPATAAGAAILASAMQGFGATQEEPAIEESSSAAEPVGQTPQPEPVASIPEPPAAETFPTMEQPASSSEDTPSQQAQVVTENPFDSHEYDNEEVLTDAYSPFVAQQNQRSLGLTSDQLQGLTPTDLQNAQSPLAASNPVPDVEAEETFPTFETAMQPAEPVREPVRPTVEPRDSLETREESGPLGPNSLSDEFLVNRNEVLRGDGTPANSANPVSVDVDPVEANVGSGYVPLDPSAVPVAAASEQATSAEPIQPKHETFGEQVVAPNVAVPDLPVADGEQAAVGEREETVFHEQTLNPNDSDIRRQAEEIIRSLGNGEGEAPRSVTEPFPVSHETQLPEPTIEEETNAIEATIQRSIEVGQAAESSASVSAPPPIVMPDINAIQQALQAAQDSNGYQQPVGAEQTQPVPQQVSPQQMSPQKWPVPAEVPPSQPTVPQQVVPQQAAPQQVMPQQVAPQQAVPQQVVPQQVVPQQAAPPMPPVPQPPTSIPVQMAEDPVQTEQQILQQVREQSAMIAETTTEAQGQDDQDILAINAQPTAAQVLNTPAGDEQLPEWTHQDPSTGEAARVDYQKLFDQLRNVPGQQQ